MYEKHWIIRCFLFVNCDYVLHYNVRRNIFVRFSKTLLAFNLCVRICAAMASTTAVSDAPRARKYGRVSIGLSVSGIAITVLIIVVVVAVVLTECKHNSYQGSCYRYKTYVGSSGSCDYGVKSTDGHCYSKHCPYYEYPWSDACYKYRNYVGYGYGGVCSGVRSYDDYCYSTSCLDYMYLGKCYKYKEYVSSFGDCTGTSLRSSDNYCYYMYCPPHVYEYRGSCYKYRKYVGIAGYCSGVKASSGDYCYFTFCPGYLHQGSCYGNNSYVGRYGSCSGVKLGGYCYSDRYEWSTIHLSNTEISAYFGLYWSVTWTDLHISSDKKIHKTIIKHYDKLQ